MQYVSLQRCLVTLMVAALISVGAGQLPEVQAQEGSALTLEASSAVLMEVHTGEVLFAKEEELRIGPASLAKLMTMYLVFEALADGSLHLEQEVTIDEDAWASAPHLAGTSVMFLGVGDVVTIEELIYGLSVSSGNDAAVALAKAVAGSESVFVERMNRRVDSFGLGDTRFTNSHGLPSQEEQYTTAYDTAMLGARLLRDFPETVPYLIQGEFTYAGIPQLNRNALARLDSRVTGLKTGYTGTSGYHLAASAEENGMHLVAVVLGIHHESEAEAYRLRELDAQRLYEDGFRNFQTVSVPWQQAGDEVRVWKGRENWLAVQPEPLPHVTLARTLDLDEMAVRFALPGPIEAPVQSGERIGELVVELPGDGGERRFQLVAAEAVERGHLLKVMWDAVRLFFGGVTGT